MGISSNPIVVFGPDSSPKQVWNSTSGVSAPSTWAAPPPLIDPAVAALLASFQSKHGGGNK